MTALTVLVATDGSECAQVAIDLVRTTHWPEGSVVHIVTVVDHAPSSHSISPLTDTAERPELSAPMIGGIAQELNGAASSMADFRGQDRDSCAQRPARNRHR